jgi:hypothetical protein
MPNLSYIYCSVSLHPVLIRQALLLQKHGNGLIHNNCKQQLKLHAHASFDRRPKTNLGTVVSQGKFRHYCSSLIASGAFYNNQLGQSSMVVCSAHSAAPLPHYFSPEHSTEG